jgi:putative ABC transport system permease protein
MKPGQFNAIAQDLRRSPDVLGVSGRNAGWDNARAIAEGQRQQINTTIETVDANYLSLLDIPIVAGRGFSPGYSADSTQSVLVNETFAREAGWKDPIGRTITLPVENNKSVRVVGVVRDHYFQPLNVRIKAQIFSLTLGRGITGFFIKIKPHSEASALPFIGKTFKARLPLNPFDYYFKDQENRNNYAAEEKWREVVGFGAAVTIFLSCIGLFGLSVFAAEKRTKEIGIRKVLGAPVTGIAAQLSSAFLRLVVLALLIAIPVAWLAANQWLGNYPYRIPLSPWLFAGAALLVVAIAAVTVSTHAIKAAMANPVKSLRSE